MSLDTKYRPDSFDDVLGQDSTIDVLKKIVQEGREFQKSYVFAGPSGTGKTTTARILARAMLCDDVTSEGEPCNQCESCTQILENGQSRSFKEMDAANHSGKEDVQKILQDLEYYTLDGNNRRIYLIDECHRLSKAAMDALLKPMEDDIKESGDKKLVCLFCTTEPDKLRTTIQSRCMVFPIREPEKDDVVDRLSYICDEEGIDYTREGLEIIFSQGNGHIRDMVNALEKVGRSSKVDASNVRSHLGLSAYSKYFDIMIHLGSNLQKASESLQEALQLTDPSSIYTGIAEASMAAYRIAKGIKGGISYGDDEKAQRVFDAHGENLLPVIDEILDSQDNVNEDILFCKVFMLHRALKGESSFGREMTVKVSEESVEQASDSSIKDGDQNEGGEKDDEKEQGKEGGITLEEEEYAQDISTFGANFVNHDRTPSKKQIEEEEREGLRDRTSDRPSPEPADEEELRSMFDEMW